MIDLISAIVPIYNVEKILFFGMQENYFWSL